MSIEQTTIIYYLKIIIMGHVFQAFSNVCFILFCRDSRLYKRGYHEPAYDKDPIGDYDEYEEICSSEDAWSSKAVGSSEEIQCSENVSCDEEPAATDDSVEGVSGTEEGGPAAFENSVEEEEKSLQTKEEDECLKMMKDMGLPVEFAQSKREPCRVCCISLYFFVSPYVSLHIFTSLYLYLHVPSICMFLHFLIQENLI